MQQDAPGRDMEEHVQCGFFRVFRVVALSTKNPKTLKHLKNAWRKKNMEEHVQCV